MGKLISKGGSEVGNLPYIPDNTLAQLTVKELNKKVRQMEIQVMIETRRMRRRRRRMRRRRDHTALFKTNTQPRRVGKKTGKKR